MAIQFLYPQYEVVRNADRCIACRVCERQCANEVHRYDPDRKRMVADESKCVCCHRCVSLCPTRALKIGPFVEIAKEAEGRHCAIFTA